MILNLFSHEWDEERGDEWQPGYGWKRRGLRRPLGGELIGASLYELPPGKATWAYHWHWANEELLIVLEGQVSLRGHEGEQELRRGHAVLFPRGRRGAHRLRNVADRPARLLLCSTMLHPEVGEYPDSGKLVVSAGAPPIPGEDAPLEALYRKDDAVGYWEGELELD